MSPLSNKRRILCAVPPTGRLVREDRCQTPVENLKTIALRPPLDLLCAAGGLERGGSVVSFFDFPAEGAGWNEFESLLRSEVFGDVLLSATTVSLARDLEAAAFVKRICPTTRVGAIGAHFNVLDKEVLATAPSLDYVLRGEYEHTCVELGQGRPLSEIRGLTWRADDGSIVQNPARPLERNLDALPWPARHLANNSLYTRPDTGETQVTLVTNRGCPYHCTKF
jgi:radical SAM superfamily enzyme YgiQ (UPF0313 family)